MSRLIIINLPVGDPGKSKGFFEELGLDFNEELSDDNATCFNIDNNVAIALLPSDHFRSAINNNEVVDATNSNEILLSVGLASRQEVDTFIAKAVYAGGNEISKPAEYGPIYGATFADLDGHQWNVFHMDLTKDSS